MFANRELVSSPMAGCAEDGRAELIGAAIMATLLGSTAAAFATSDVTSCFFASVMASAVDHNGNGKVVERGGIALDLLFHLVDKVVVGFAVSSS